MLYTFTWVFIHYTAMFFFASNLSTVKMGGKLCNVQSWDLAAMERSEVNAAVHAYVVSRLQTRAAWFSALKNISL